MKCYIAKQAIVDENKNIVAYELLYRDSDHGIINMPSNYEATMHVKHCVQNLIKNNPEFNVTRFFLNCDEEFILSDNVKNLDTNIFVLELLETIDINDEVIERIKELKNEGFSFAIDDYNCSDLNFDKFKPIMNLVDIVKICLHEVDVRQNQCHECSECCKMLKEKHVNILAEKVEDLEEFLACKKIGFGLFQGYYFGKPEIIEVNLKD